MEKLTTKKLNKLTGLKWNYAVNIDMFIVRNKDFIIYLKEILDSPSNCYRINIFLQEKMFRGMFRFYFDNLKKLLSAIDVYKKLDLLEILKINSNVELLNDSFFIKDHFYLLTKNDLYSQIKLLLSSYN